MERDDLPDQHVAEEIRRGYKLRERLLRPALVRVASNPKQKANECQSEQSRLLRGSGRLPRCQRSGVEERLSQAWR